MGTLDTISEKLDKIIGLLDSRGPGKVTERIQRERDVDWLIKKCERHAENGEIARWVVLRHSKLFSSALDILIEQAVAVGRLKKKTVEDGMGRPAMVYVITKKDSI